MMDETQWSALSVSYRERRPLPLFETVGSYLPSNVPVENIGGFQAEFDAAPLEQERVRRWGVTIPVSYHRAPL
jgi:hypothetical protein